MPIPLAIAAPPVFLALQRLAADPAAFSAALDSAQNLVGAIKEYLQVSEADAKQVVAAEYLVNSAAKGDDPQQAYANLPAPVRDYLQNFPETLEYSRAITARGSQVTIFGLAVSAVFSLWAGYRAAGVIGRYLPLFKNQPYPPPSEPGPRSTPQWW